MPTRAGASRRWWWAGAAAASLAAHAGAQEFGPPTPPGPDLRLAEPSGPTHHSSLVAGGPGAIVPPAPFESAASMRPDDLRPAPRMDSDPVPAVLAAVPAPAASATTDALPLSPASRAPAPGSGGHVSPRTELGPTLVTTASVVGLILVLGLLVRLCRRGGLRQGLNTSRAPSGILEVLGRYPLASGPTLLLLRVDRRVLLLSQARASRLSGATLTALAEFDGVDDVASILAQARDAQDESISARFSSLLGGFAAEHRAVSVEAPDPGEPWEIATAAPRHDDAGEPGRAALSGGGAASTALRRRLEGVRAWEGATA